MRRNIAFLAAAVAVNAAVMALPITLGNAPAQQTSVLIHFAQAALRQPKAGLRPAPTENGMGRAARLTSPNSSPAPTVARASDVRGVSVAPTASTSNAEAGTNGGGTGGGTSGGTNGATGTGARSGSDGAGAGGTGGEGAKPPAPSAPSAEELRAYESRVREKVLALVAYPEEAKRAAYEGTVKVRILIDGRGNLADATIKTTSGFRSLDDEALSAIRKAAPFGPPPGGGERRLILPIIFRLET